MWPEIKRENKKGIKFDEDFWRRWGPSKMFYFNPHLFDDTRTIKSINSLYLTHTSITFNPEEIAMGLIYECGEFGEHTTLFSYVDIPKLKYEENCWRSYVLPSFSTDIDTLVDLYNYKILENNGQMSEEQVYQNYMEDTILSHHSDKKMLLREACKELVENYKIDHQSLKVDLEVLYAKLLEEIIEKGNWLKFSCLDRPMNWQEEWTKAIKGSKKEVKELILDILKLPSNKKKDTPTAKQKYQQELAFLNKEDNDLNSIFYQTRDIFLNHAVQFEASKMEISLPFLSMPNDVTKGEITKKEIIIENAKTGKVIKGKNGIAEFEPDKKQLEDPSL